MTKEEKSIVKIDSHQQLDTGTIESEKPDEKEVAYALDIWKKTIDVQQHFNTIEMQIRNFAVQALLQLRH
ncbi:MAG: hypothetical protein MI924_21905 [Chloroflexales bacterium]|nr:hypothetical protein [Chloroflexales bacterium]